MLSCAILSIIMFANAHSADAQGYKIVVNEANTTAALPSAEVAQMFMKKKTSWATGETVAPVDLAPSSPTRAAFLLNVLHKDLNSIKLYWQQQLFAGRGTPPDEKASDAAVVAFVKENPGAIGYVSSDAQTSGVKVLTVH